MPTSNCQMLVTTRFGDVGRTGSPIKVAGFATGGFVHNVRPRVAIAVVVAMATVGTGAVSGSADAKPKKPKKAKVNPMTAGLPCKNELEIGYPPSGPLICMPDANGKLAWHRSQIPYWDTNANNSAASAMPAAANNLRFDPLPAAENTEYWAYLSSVVGYYLPGQISGYSIRYVTDANAEAASQPFAGVGVLELIDASVANRLTLVTRLAQTNQAELLNFGEIPGFIVALEGVDVIYLAYSTHLVRIAAPTGKGVAVVNALFATAGIPQITQ
jgi:hypothetical protein